jgi:hypothetical protein
MLEEFGYDQFKVNMRPGGIAGTANMPDYVTLVDNLTDGRSEWLNGMGQ